MADLKGIFTDFSLAEAYGLAVKVETDGYTFYESALQLAGDDRMKEDLEFLRDQEKGHKRLFEKLLKDSGQDYRDGSGSPLSVWAENELFTPLRDILEKNPPRTSEEALRIGLDMETRSIELYKKLKKEAKSKDDKTALGKVIKEEQNHKKFLKAILKYSSMRLALLSELGK